VFPGRGTGKDEKNETHEILRCNSFADATGGAGRIRCTARQGLGDTDRDGSGPDDRPVAHASVSYNRPAAGRRMPCIQTRADNLRLPSCGQTTTTSARRARESSPNGEERYLAHWAKKRIDAATDLREANSEGVREEQAATVIHSTSCCKQRDSDY